MTLEFATAQRILVGRGKVSVLGETARGLGRRAFLVTGSHVDAAPIISLLDKHGVRAVPHTAHGEPDVRSVDDAATLAREAGCELCISVGGGSVMDLAKAVAGMVPNGGSVKEYLEGVGTGRMLERPALPHVALPTTAGTGSEVTRNAVVSSKVEGFKKSIRSPLLIPTVALVDPALTDLLPPEQTACTGLDALTQLLEPYVSPRATPVTDALSREGLRRAVLALPRVVQDGKDTSARDDMALCALLGGLCLANAGLGAVHGIAAALGARFDIAHGFACACVLWQATEANIRALEQREPQHASLARYATVAELLCGRSFSSRGAALTALVQRLQGLVKELAVPSLGRFGVLEQHLDALVPESRGSSMKANPVVLTDDELRAVFRAAL